MDGPRPGPCANDLRSAAAIAATWTDWRPQTTDCYHRKDICSRRLNGLHTKESASGGGLDDSIRLCSLFPVPSCVRVCQEDPRGGKEQVEMACPAQSMLSASGGIFLRSKPQAASYVRGSIIGGGGSIRPFLLTCNASSPPAPTQEDPDCNEEECAPEKEVGSLSAEWLAEERTQVVGTFPPKSKRKWGYVEKDTAGQTNIYSVEPMVYVSESAISSGTAGTSADGAENTAAIAAGLVLITVASAASILIQVNKSQPKVSPEAAYSGPPLSYYVAKFQPAVAQTLEAPAPAEAVEAAAAPEATSTVEASAAPEAQELSS